MNRRIGNLIRVGMFAALGLSPVAFAQSADEGAPPKAPSTDTVTPPNQPEQQPSNDMHNDEHMGTTKDTGINPSNKDKTDQLMPPDKTDKSQIDKTPVDKSAKPPKDKDY